MRAALYFYEGFLSVSPSVVGAALELRARGYDVDIFYNQPAVNLPAPQLPAGITLHEHVPRTKSLVRAVFDRLRREKLRQISTQKIDDTVRRKGVRLRALAKGVIATIELPQFAWFCRRRAPRPDLAIAFDMNSLAAMDFALPRSVPFIYWSLEIMRLADTQEPFSRWMKRHEIRRLPQARAVVAQAPIRRALIEQDMPEPIQRYVEVPNAPSHAMPAVLPKDFYSSRFPIPEKTWIVLHAGVIGAAAMSLELAETVPSWPPGFVLVYHERQKRSLDEPYMQAVQRAGGERTFLSLTPLPMEDVDLVYCGAHIGLVCYQTADVNDGTAWASSGKLVYYLRHGLPIIVVAPVCPPLISEWQCGIHVRSLEEIKDALVAIAADYETCSARARRAYAAGFDFHAAFTKLMDVVQIPMRTVSNAHDGSDAV